ncbi:MAG TPA: hypothetical protein VK949_04460 [Methylotenera sp.]|nr:hypothetical protein [Methylotenera sp.]
MVKTLEGISICAEYMAPGMAALPDAHQVNNIEAQRLDMIPFGIRHVGQFDLIPGFS